MSHSSAAPAATQVTGGVCLLTQTEVYEEQFCVRPITALQGSHDVLIQSRLRSAKNPAFLQTRYRTGLGLEELARLHKFLGDYLAHQQAQLATTSDQEQA